MLGNFYNLKLFLITFREKMNFQYKTKKNYTRRKPFSNFQCIGRCWKRHVENDARKQDIDRTTLRRF